MEEIMELTERDLNYQPYKILALTLTWPLDNRTVKEAVSGNWNINIDKAREADLVFAVKGGVVIGIFKPTKWELTEPDPGKEGVDRNFVRFESEEVTDPNILKKYLHKRIFKKKGEANPPRYYY